MSTEDFPSPCLPYFPYFRDEKYPKNVQVNFRKLSFKALEKYAKVNEVNVRPDATKEELAVAAALHFSSCKVREDQAIKGFLEKCEVSNAVQGFHSIEPTWSYLINGPSAELVASYSEKILFKSEPHEKKQKSSKQLNPEVHNKSKQPKAKPANTNPLKSDAIYSGKSSRESQPERHSHKMGSSSQKVKRHKSHRHHKRWIRSGEQVAAKVDDTWILASIVRYNPEFETYDVQDEDDTKTKIQVSAKNVIKLGLEHDLEKDEKVLAIFPETTSFYRGVLARPLRHQHTLMLTTLPGSPHVYEAAVKFHDDQDATGKTPSRRIPARYVVKYPEKARERRFSNLDSDSDDGGFSRTDCADILKKMPINRK
mmetsp:Transcript_4363/g.6018  ORF Transcript_4363/g.6018 Transcript_4363/m.6018 type:complete len:368 (-) Transcript_4363:304-1407(-)